MARRKILTDEELRILLEEMPSDVDTPSEDSDSEYSEPDKENHSPLPQKDEEQIAPVDSSSSDNEEDEEQITPIVRKFTKKDCITTIPIFTLQKGPVEHYFLGKTSPTDVFLTIMSEKMISDIVYQTNLYIQQKQRNVRPVTVEDMYGFLGLEFLFGYHRLPQVRHYWSNEMDLSVPIVSQTMSRERYKQILSNLHVNDNLAMPSNNKDKLYKIRPLVTSMNEAFQKFRVGDQYQSIDESIVRFKGRSSLKQYNPMKPIKRGYKLWCRADMSGYIHQFEIYQGKSDEESKKKIGLGGSVVVQLTSSLHHNNYVVMMDNYFTSVELFEYLKSQGIAACGTIRPNRKALPTLENDKNLERGQFDFRKSEQGISYFKWRDNRCVHLLSNYHGNEVTTVKRTQKDGSKIDVPAPVIVNDYNTHMGGVDKADMLRSLYDRNKRSKKWWHRLFFAIIEIALVNSFVLYTELYGKMPFLEYKRKVSQGMLTKGRKAEKKRGRPRQDNSSSPSVNNTGINKRRKGFSVSSDIRLQNRGAHWPEFVAQRSRCEFCAMKKIESRPHSRCKMCKVFLCVNERKNCFYEYHHM